MGLRSAMLESAARSIWEVIVALLPSNGPALAVRRLGVYLMLQNSLDHCQGGVGRHRFRDGRKNCLQRAKKLARNGVKAGVGIRWEFIK